MSEETSNSETARKRKTYEKHPFKMSSGEEAYTSFVFPTDDEGEVTPKTCPKMPDVQASSYEDITEHFGWRKVSTYADGTARYIPQSWSAAARNNAAKARRKAAKAAAESDAAEAAPQQ